MAKSKATRWETKRAAREVTSDQLQKGLRRWSWKRLVEIYLATTSRRMKRQIVDEARRCGYSMRGLLVARTLRMHYQVG